MWGDLMAEARVEIQKKIKAMEMNNDKQKKQIQESVLITFLNQRLESTHITSFNHHFKHALIQKHFHASHGELRTTEEFQNMFVQCMEIGERDQNEYKTQLVREMNKFTNKNLNNDGTESDRSSLTYQTGVSKGPRGQH